MRRQMVDKTYDIHDDNMVKSGNISASAIHGEISTIQDEVSAEKKKKFKTKTIDINDAQYNMGHMGEVASRRFLSHHNIKATGKFRNCVSCMKWKAQTEQLIKLQWTQPSIQESVCILMLMDHFHYQWEEKSIG
jgi:hypothetical protein